MPRSSFTQALCALALLAAGAAQAGIVSGRDCAVTDLSGNLATDCLGYIKDNDTLDGLQTLAGGLAWHGITLSSLTQYKDERAGAGSTTALFDVATTATDASTGKVTFLQGISGPAVLTIKGGNHLAAYYLPNGVAAGVALDFDIPGAAQGAGLSHASVFTAAVPQLLPPPVTAVPEPAAIALVALALGGAAAGTWRARRRKG